MKLKVNYIFLLMIVSLNTLGQALPVSGNQYHLYGPNSNWGEYFQVGGNGQITNHAFIATTNGNLHLDSKAGFATYINHYNQGPTFINTQGGNVGIGTTNPSEKLDVNGNINVVRVKSSTAIFNSNSRNSLNSFNTGQDPNLSGGWIAADFGGNDNASDRLVVGTGFGGKVVIGTHNFNLTQWGGDILISPNGGNVAIGTTSAREKLSVNGKIRAHEIKVEIQNWPDYVFLKGYEKASLKDIKRYIDTYGHLPEVPSAEEVKEKGASLGEINKVLLKKIEELTLHLIEKEDEIDVLKQLRDKDNIQSKKEQKSILERLGALEEIITHGSNASTKTFN